MQILSIGNSFSTDAHRYLHDIAKSDGVKLQTFNLFIPGAPLAAHYRNMLSKERAYLLEMNGRSVGFKVSLEEALLNRSWDVVTIQQNNLEPPKFRAYELYLEELVAYIRKCVPGAKVMLHQTWAYEEGSPRLTQMMGIAHAQEMLDLSVDAYNKAAKLVNADGVIPCGEVFGKMLENGIEKVHRDTYHAGLGLGRFALGLTWYKCLTGNDVMGVSFRDLDVEVTQEGIDTVKKCVTQVTRGYGY